MTAAFPLHWPDGWPRTPAGKRQPWRTEVAFTQARDELLEEASRLRGRLFILSTNMELNTKGLPFPKQRLPEDPGVALWFLRGDRQQAIACDRWTTVTGNMRALRATIDALRGLERWGSTAILDRVWHAFDALPAPKAPDCWAILGLRPGAPAESIAAAFRALARTAHPDAGGSLEAMQALTAARDAALREAR